MQEQTTSPPSRSKWEQLFHDFHACHKSGLNVLLHLFTTPLGLLGFLALAQLAIPKLPYAIAACYMIGLLGRVPVRVFLATGATVAGLLAMNDLLAISWQWAIGMLVAGYVFQELAHLITGEATFESTYISERGWFEQWTAHTFYLLPLVLAAAGHRETSPLWWLVAHDRALLTSLDAPEHTQDIATIRQWIDEQSPTKEHTTHWWWYDLPEAARDAYVRLAESRQIRDMFGRFYGMFYEVDVVWGMNEIYVAGPDQKMTSDTVFYDSHIDGPWAVFPFASVYRCLLALTPNERISTHFPMIGTEYQSGGKTFTLTTGDALAFDFNRELHYISCDASKPHYGQRYILKLHYVVYPRVFKPYGMLLKYMTTKYNEIARQAFLDTLTPDSLMAKIGAFQIVATTKSFEIMGRWLGPNNIVYVAQLLLLSFIFDSTLPFIVGASFVHYLLYIATYNHRHGVAFGTFLRDAVFFKTISMGILAVLYLLHFSPNPTSIALMVGGFGLAALAARALGVVKTYFGVELGYARPERISAFPYGLIPHPMIVGAIIGLTGVHLVIGEVYPWLVPVHIGLYLVHLFQEATTPYPGAPPTPTESTT